MKEIKNIKLDPTTEKLYIDRFETGDWQKTDSIQFINDWGDFGAKTFAIGREFGLEAIVTAQNVQDAIEAWLDEQPTIEEDEVEEAYNGDPENGELDEAYQYQANFTGTGIVNVGHNLWITEVHPVVQFSEMRITSDSK